MESHELYSSEHEQAVPTTQIRNPLLQPDLYWTILLNYTLKRHLRRWSPGLAQTCHALSDPVLDYLWRELDTLKPLS